MNQTEATAIVSGFIGKFTKEELSVKLGMSRCTLDARLKKNNWKKGDFALIEKLK